MLRFKRSRVLDAEIDTFTGKWGLDGVQDSLNQMGVNSKVTVRKSAAPGSRTRLEQHKQAEDACNMKDCYCRATQKQRQNDKQVVESRPRVTWDQILSQQISSVSQSTVRNKACQVDDGERHGNEQPTNWCHPHCFVEKLSQQAPGHLLTLKSEVDKAITRLDLGDCLPSGNRNRRPEVNRDRVVLEYLEDLSLQMLKKRLDESETKYKSMKSKLEDALVAQKLEIQSLKKELTVKNDEIIKLSMKPKLDGASDLMQRERDFIQRIRSLDDRMKAMMERDERNTTDLEKYKQAVSDLKGELSRAEEDRDLFKAKMEIYQQERDKAVASLSVYEKMFKNLKNELGHEIREMRPSLDLTADSCGTLECLEPRGLATSSPNVSFSYSRSRSPSRKSTKKRTKHTLVTSNVQSLSPDKHLGKDLLKKLEGLGKEFKQFSEKMVIPMAMGLDVEAAQMLDVSASTGLSWTDVDSSSVHSSITRHSS